MELRLALSRDEWFPTLGQDNAISEAMLRALSSTGSEAGGWNAVVQPALDYSNLFRVNATELRIRLPAKPNYLVSAPETLQLVVPASALLSNQTLHAPPIELAATGGLAFAGGELLDALHEEDIRSASTSPCSTTRGCRPS
jgi:hypothetical protein